MAFFRRKLGLGLVAAALLLGGRGRTEGSRAPSGAADRATGSTIVFPYRQRILLYSRNAAGGLAYVSPHAAPRASLPVVVFLHGMNPDELVHPWFGASADGRRDLRTVLDALVAEGRIGPLVVAAPTHTRYATGATVMWPRFDLADFLDATEAALGATAMLDRARVIVVGHSGAGCNAAGGIFAEGVRQAKPLAVVDVDGCVDETTVPALARASASTMVRFVWQRAWARPIAELESGCPACKVDEITDLAGAGSPHDAILPEALRRVLPELLPPAPR